MDLMTGDANRPAAGHSSNNEAAGVMNVPDNSLRAPVNLRNWLVVLLLMAGMIFSLIDRFSFSLMIDPIKAHYKLSDSEIGLINGIAFGLIYSLMGLPLGLLADRWSRKGTIALGVGVWSIATALCGLSSSATQFGIARTLVGAGEAGLAPAAYGIIHDRFTPRTRSRAMSVFQMGAVFGAGLAFIVAGAVYRYFLEGGRSFAVMDGLDAWQKTFIALAAPGVPYILLLCLLRDRVVARPTGGQSAKWDYSGVAANLPRYALLFLGMGGISIASSAFLTWMPTIISREFGWSPSRVGAAYGMILLTLSPAGLFLGGWLSDLLVGRGRKDAHAIVSLMSATAAVPLSLAVGFAPSASTLFPILAVAHFVLCFALGSTPAYIQIITPKHARGQVSAVYVLALNLLGIGLGSALIGSLSSMSAHDPRALRHSVIEVIVPALVLAVILLAALVWRERRPAPPTVASAPSA
ncbi:MAG: major facilitator superfamily 1 [Bradyrhizobium sp.]|nr:major facilitator superfamily 1 [Bradyrhizobium sp.]